MYCGSFGYLSGSLIEICDNWLSLLPLAVNVDCGRGSDVLGGGCFLEVPLVANWPKFYSLLTHCQAHGPVLATTRLYFLGHSQDFAVTGNRLRGGHWLLVLLLLLLVTFFTLFPARIHVHGITVACEDAARHVGWTGGFAATADQKIFLVFVALFCCLS
eukprot:GHVT01013293.1.p1 GENE.GHVT01013293.1~~GHVT01013293.1.p1  ORF type:complete len:159 (-),score=0.78 GHVT01013293.1:19-495(-)